jgi:hypothetical protein
MLCFYSFGSDSFQGNCCDYEFTMSEQNTVKNQDAINAGRCYEEECTVSGAKCSIAVGGDFAGMHLACAPVKRAGAGLL